MITESIALNILHFSAGVFAATLIMVLIGVAGHYIREVLPNCYICGRVRFWCEHRRRN
jgi:hypothetical protein